MSEPKSKSKKSKLLRKKNKKITIGAVKPTCDTIKEKYARNAKASRDIQNKEYQSLLKCMSAENRENFNKYEEKNKCLSSGVKKKSALKKVTALITA